MIRHKKSHNLQITTLEKYSAIITIIHPVYILELEKL